MCFFKSSKQSPLACLRYKDSRSSILEGDPYIFHDNGTLEIPIAQAQNSAKYTCVARNKFGISENQIYLEVKGESISAQTILIL